MLILIGRQVPQKSSASIWWTDLDRGSELERVTCDTDEEKRVNKQY